jgi:hypothetical protein
MGMVAPQQRIASAFVVFCGQYGDVGRHAQASGMSRQSVYAQAHRVAEQVAGVQEREERARQSQRIKELEEQVAVLERRQQQTVVLDREKQAAFAIMGQALGVSLPECRELLDFLIPGQTLSVATLGRRTQAAGKQAGQVLAVLDEQANQRVRQAAADEIYVQAPVLMTVEQESLCWLSGRLSEHADGESWAKEFRQLPHVEQVTRDGGTGLAKGVALVNEERAQQGKPPVVDQGDHFHALRGGSIGLHHAEKQATVALAKAEAAQQELLECQRQGRDARGASRRAQVAWQRAEAAMDRWSELERTWQRTKEALRLVTPDGELNTRAQVEAVLAETLPQLPDGAFAKVKRQLHQPEMLNFLDQVHEKLQAVPVAEELKQAAQRQECLRRCPEALQGDSPRAAALRGVLLASAVVLSLAGEAGQQATAAVRDIFRRAYRASSLVECLNSVLRMQQARHRKLTQGMLDLKRLYWNSHTFRTGRRRGTTPYQRLGAPWPEGKHWLDLLKMTPEQLRHELSNAQKAT